MTSQYLSSASGRRRLWEDTRLKDPCQDMILKVSGWPAPLARPEACAVYVLRVMANICVTFYLAAVIPSDSYCVGRWWRVGQDAAAFWARA